MTFQIQRTGPYRNKLLRPLIMKNNNDHDVNILGIDYPTWWFLVVGALFSGYAILDGFDLGAGALHLFFRTKKAGVLR